MRMLSSAFAHKTSQNIGQQESIYESDQMYSKHVQKKREVSKFTTNSNNLLLTDFYRFFILTLEFFCINLYKD